MFYQRQGEVPRKPFTHHRTPDGAETHEELVTSDGFNGPSSLVYRLRPSTAVTKVSQYPARGVERWTDGTLTNRRLELSRTEDADYYRSWA